MHYPAPLAVALVVALVVALAGSAVAVPVSSG